MFNILTLGFDSAFSASKTATSIVLRQHKSPLISQEISGFSLFSELFEDTFSGGGGLTQTVTHTGVKLQVWIDRAALRMLKYVACVSLTNKLQ